MAARLESVDLNLLVALHALLEERHVTNAAARIHQGQSAMSGTLRRLRAHFGDELLVRVGNELQLTPFAKALVPMTRDAYEAAGALFGAGTEFDPATSARTFSIALSDYAMARFGGPLLSALQAAAPYVSVTLEPIPAALIRDADIVLLQYDVVILPREALAGYLRTSVPLFDDDFVIALGACSDLPDVVALTPDDLAARRQLVISYLPTSRYVPLEGYSAFSSLASSDTKIKVASYLALAHLLRTTDAWALLPRSLAALYSDQLRLFEVPTPTDRFIEHAFWHPSRERDAGLVWLRDLMTTVAAGAE